MGRDRYRILDPAAPHFLTCTVLEWLPLFAQPANAQILLDSLEYLQENAGLTLYGYVILENHGHLLARSPHIGKTMASFKSFTAGKIIRRAELLRASGADRDCNAMVRTRAAGAARLHSHAGAWEREKGRARTVSWLPRSGVGASVDAPASRGWTCRCNRRTWWVRFA